MKIAACYNPAQTDRREVALVAERTREYELVIVLSPEATEEEVSTTVEMVDGLIKDRGGTVGEHESWGLRRLAFPVMKFQEGNYALTRFESSPGSLAELERNLNASQDILRFLVTKAHGEPTPSS